ncbi:PQQ-binding-like beta-propeller repeat protein [Kitasatospora purpeofusca]|uniref:outer membrane protein assembly factor BamB family protein n=1 Tax=Kitasatospora purpeofusca TaxID=67352 RepID=UPI002A5A389E|nr:PQQ-binding-like beta-propeller repeat protein [Kitasatospora purpeofusca]MDY0814906.1 PQQ-binding-like beta-propeller repeat protein [Kitasatospora purpeofusca]
MSRSHPPAHPTGRHPTGRHPEPIPRGPISPDATSPDATSPGATSPGSTSPPAGPRRRRTGAALLSGFALLAPALAAGALGGAVPARADSPTVSVNTMRTAWDANEPGLAPAQVSGADFGRRWSTAVDGAVYAQPLVAGSTVVVATSTNHVYGVNASDGKILWQRALGTPVASSTACLSPGTGIISTPVYDKATKTVYLVSKSGDGGAHFSVHALDATTGASRSGWPVTVAGSPVNSPGVPFNPNTSAQRAGLLLLDGAVYFGFASDCGVGTYVGTVAGVNTSTRKLTLWSTESGSASQNAGVWMSGGGLVSDGSGRIFVATGNGAGEGSSPLKGPGDKPGGHFAESVVRLGVNSDGSLAPRDFFSPTNNREMDHGDVDLGSGGPVALPSGFGNAAHPHLMVQVGKDGRIFLLDRDRLGGMGQGPNGTDGVVGTTGPFKGVWGHAGVWGGDGGYVYLVENYGSLRALKYSVNSAGNPQLTSAATSPEGFGYASGSPVVTSNGTAAGSALVWSIYSGTGPGGQNGELRAYDALPVNGSLKLRRSFALGTVTRFSVPATDGGRVFVGTKDGHLVAFGRST